MDSIYMGVFWNLVHLWNYNLYLLYEKSPLFQPEIHILFQEVFNTFQCHLVHQTQPHCFYHHPAVCIWSMFSHWTLNLRHISFLTAAQCGVMSTGTNYGISYGTWKMYRGQSRDYIIWHGSAFPWTEILGKISYRLDHL